MSLFQAFKDNLPKLSALNLYGSQERYYCTPVEAVPLASIGADGIYFCILPRVNQTLDDSPVLVISPLSEVEVIPVAETIRDFISLVITLQDAGGIEAAALREKDSFLRYFEENLLLDDLQHAIDIHQAVRYCKEAFGIFEMADPYEYVQTVKQKLRTIPYTLPD